MPRIALPLLVCVALGCGPKQVGVDGGSETNSEDATDTVIGDGDGEPATTSQAEESRDETGDDDEPPDACPATPALDWMDVSFDSWHGYEYPEQADWELACTVAAHTGDLLEGESITLDCVTAEGQAVQHLIEVEARLLDAEQPTTVPVAVGEPIQLSLWSRVWWQGGAVWMLRNPDQGDDIRLLYYSTIELPDPDDTDFSPLPSFIAPVELAIADEPCGLVCPDPEEPTTFVPPDECDCEREQSLELRIGDVSTTIQNGSAGPVGSSMFAFVATAKLYPTGGCPDSADAWYSLMLVAR